MSILLIPFGKGTGRFWLIAFIVITVALTAYFGYESLIDGINSGRITNFILILLTYLIYPVYFICFWCLKLILSWGVFAVIPIVIIIIILSYLSSSIVALIKKLINKTRQQKTA